MVSADVCVCVRGGEEEFMRMIVWLKMQKFIRTKVISRSKRGAESNCGKRDEGRQGGAAGERTRDELQQSVQCTLIVR